MRHRLDVPGCIGALALLVAGSWASAGDPCEEQWDNAIGQPGVDGVVFALGEYDGELIVGGEFTEAGGVSANAIARWDASRESWSALGDGMSSDLISPRVLALTVFEGDLIAGGWFDEADGEVVNNIARWDGTSWQPMGAGVDNAVYALAVHDGALIAGGFFTSAGGTTANYMARWDANVQGWSAMGSGMNNGVLALTVHEGELIAGGGFTLASGTSINRIASWDESSESWASLGVGIDGPVAALGAYEGDLIAGGQFGMAGGVRASGIARWDNELAIWQPLGEGMSGESTPDVRTLAAHQGELYAGGSFTGAGGGFASGIARWDGATWSAVGTGVDGSALAILPRNGALVAGGSFTMAGGRAADSIATWHGCAPVCVGDFVTGDSFEPPGDGVVDGADLAYLLGEWGANPGSLADVVSSVSFEPPPDGVVDGADLAVLLGAWGACG